MKDPELIPAVYGNGPHARGSSAVASSAAFSGSDDSQQTPKKRKAWVVADWKVRLPGTALVKESAAARKLRLKQAAEERKEQLASEYAELYTTIDGILQRCDGITKAYGSKSQHKQQREQSGHTHLTMRSRALHANARPSTPAATSITGAVAGAVKPAIAQSHAQHTVQLWTQPVDLNPGMKFRPGTPQRIAATAPELPAVMALIAALSDDIKRLDMTQLTHRERLQAGIQQLTGEFYAALKVCGRMPGSQGTCTLLPSCQR